MLRAELDGPALRRLSCDPPLSAKVCTDEWGLPTLWVISSGASLLEGDELEIAVVLRAGAHLTVRSVAAQLVHPCPGGGRAGLRVDAEVGDGCALRWAPEPTIIAAGARFVGDAVVRAHEGASVHWRDELVLGRTGEDVDQIELDVATAIDVGGLPRWRDGLSSHPGWRGPAVLGTARFVGTEVRIEPTGTRPSCAEPGSVGANSAGWGDEDAGWSPVAGGGTCRRVLAVDPVDGRRRLEGPCGPHRR